jgi:hypothetical protein
VRTLSERLVRLIVVAPLVLTAVFAGLGLSLSIMFPNAEVSNRLGLPVGLLTPIAFAVIGGLIVVRKAHNTVGWLLLLLGPVGAALIWAEVYEPIVTASPDSPVGYDLERRISNFSWVAFFPLLCLTLQLFPSGQPLSPRWRYLTWLTWLWMFLGVAMVLFIVDQDSPPPPLFLAWWLGLILMSVVSIIVRTKRATGAERQQIKLLAFGAVPGLVVIPSIASVFREALPFQMVFFMWVPATIGVAVFRNRLYDIDRLVSRTIGYVILTATLLTVFALVVFGLLAVLPLTGGDAVPVAVSTLVVFALFQPLRRRIQSAIDRRFDRARYDGALTVAAFGTRLRDEVDLDSVLVDLQEVIKSTIGPSSASVWLRPTQGGVGR